jgi:high-affinity iron transporter
LLHSLIGYDSRPAGMQIIFYLTALVVIFTGMKWASRRPRSATPNKSH